MRGKLRHLSQILRMGWRGFVGGYRAGQEEVRTGRIVTLVIDFDAERVDLAVLDSQIAQDRGDHVRASAHAVHQDPGELGEGLGGAGMHRILDGSALQPDPEIPTIADLAQVDSGPLGEGRGFANGGKTHDDHDNTIELNESEHP